MGKLVFYERFSERTSAERVGEVWIAGGKLMINGPEFLRRVVQSPAGPPFGPILQPAPTVAYLRALAEQCQRTSQGTCTPVWEE